MIPVQPTYLWKYWSGKKTQLACGISRRAFLSWEDAVWDLLEAKKVPKKSIILVPEFYCPDVMENIIAHGYVWKTYLVNRDLKTPVLDFEKAIKQYKPAVIIIFHAVGIHNDLPIPNKGIVIEDCVHQIIDPHRVVIQRRDHFIIDSLRKVVPLQGSIVYGTKEDIVLFENVNHTFWYSVQVYSWWFVMQFFLMIGFVKQAERAMIKGYDIIGDNPEGAHALPGTIWLQERLDFKKICAIKTKQVIEYEKHFPHDIYKPSDRGELRGFPLLINERKIQMIRNRGLLIRNELTGCAWSKKHTIVYLPLGPHISEKQHREVIRIVRAEGTGFEPVRACAHGFSRPAP